MELDKNKIYYVYAWLDTHTKNIIYIGKGRGTRYKQKSGRNKLFCDYIKNHNCNTFILEDNLDEEAACQLEDKLIKSYKQIGQCECNIRNCTTHRGISYGNKNGFYGKKHTPEVIQKIREYNATHNCGRNNPQYGVSPSQRMSLKTYEVWKEKQYKRKIGKTNPNAKKVILFQDNNQFHFNTIKEACQWLIDNGYSSTINIESVRDMFKKHYQTIYGFNYTIYR